MAQKDEGSDGPVGGGEPRRRETRAKDQRPKDARPKDQRPKARLPRGFEDRTAGQIRATEAMIAEIRAVYERYGFEPLETPLVEYTDALGKFLPDLDRPNEGVFSFQDDDEQWLSLRYDLTAPLARYVAENYERLPKPYRSYRAGWVFRNEKPGPGRFRQFMQFDADTVGASSPAADAEMCMMMADALEAIGIKRGQYVIKVNSRKVLDGVMDLAKIEESKRVDVLRCFDKWDRIGLDGVRSLLGEGRLDESGDFTDGLRLAATQIELLLRLLRFLKFGWEKPFSIEVYRKYAHKFLGLSQLPESIEKSLASLYKVREVVRGAGYRTDQIRIDPSIVRGLEYYTGAVFEAELLLDTVNERGEKVRFGSVASGGRYDGLVGRFRGENVPATGMSMGVSRLLAALSALKQVDVSEPAGPVVVLVMDRGRIAESQKLVSALRHAGVAAELYLGDSGMKAQMKYADRRNAPLVVIQGEDERARGVVQIKDLAAGKAASAGIADHAAWREERPGQVEVAESDLVGAVQKMLAAGRGG